MSGGDGPRRPRWRLGLAAAAGLAILGLTTACGSVPAGADPVAAGREVLRHQACLKCHAIHGEGESLAPDLAGVGSRLSAAQIRQMITDPRSLRPDSRMPRYSIPEPELKALVAYLSSLK